MGVVIVEDVGADAVQERAVQNVETLGAAEHGGLLRAGKLRQPLKSPVDRFMPGTANCAADPVDEAADAFFLDLVGDLGQVAAHNPFRKRARHILTSGH
jgi:hypothetical protein